MMAVKGRARREADRDRDAIGEMHAADWRFPEAEEAARKHEARNRPSSSPFVGHTCWCGGADQEIADAFSFEDISGQVRGVAVMGRARSGKPAYQRRPRARAPERESRCLSGHSAGKAR